MAKKKTNQKKTSQPKKKQAAKKQAPKKTTDAAPKSDSITLRQFERWSPAKPFTPKKTEFKKDFTAPKFIKGNNKKLKEILLRDFSNALEESAKAEVNVAEKPKAPPAKEVVSPDIAKKEEALKAKEVELNKAEDEIAKKLADAQKALLDVTKKEEEAQKALLDAQQANEDAKKAAQEASKAKEEADAQAKDVEAKIADADAKAKDIETKIAQADAKAKEADTAKADADKIKADAQKLNEDAKKAKADADAKAEEIKKTEEEIAAKKDEAAKIEEEASKKAADIEAREKAVEEKIKEVDSKEKDLSSKEDSLNTKEEDLAAKAAEVAAKEEELGKTVFTKVSESAQKISALKPDFNKIKNPPPSFTQTSGGDINKGILGLVAGFVFLVLLLVSASISNTGNFSLKKTDDGLAVYQGKFAPTGKYLLMTLPKGYVPKDIKKNYKEDEVYAIIYSFYMDNVKDLAKVKGAPNFNKIEKHLKKAIEYSSSRKEKKLAKNQLKALKDVSNDYKSDLLSVLEKANEIPKVKKEVKAHPPKKEVVKKDPKEHDHKKEDHKKEAAHH